MEQRTTNSREMTILLRGFVSSWRAVRSVRTRPEFSVRGRRGDAPHNRLLDSRLEVVPDIAAGRKTDDLRHEHADDALVRIDEKVRVERAAPSEAALRQ